MVEKLKNFLIAILQPSGFKIGILITLTLTYISIGFYIDKEKTDFSDSKFSFLRQTHQKSIDLRLLIRGQRKGSDRVAVLAVDEKAVENLGRWPWPRGMIAQTIEKAVSHGASVIGFDMIFAEADDNQAVRALRRLSQLPSPPQVQTAIQQELQQANTDQVLANTVERLGSNLVMGVYFDTPHFDFYPQSQFCANVVYGNTAAYAYMDNDEIPVAVLDSSAIEIPETILDFLTEKLNAIEQKHKNGQHKMAAQELANFIRIEKLKFCDNWLFEEYDKSLPELRALFPEIKEEMELPEDMSFDNYIDRIRYSLKNQTFRSGKLWTNIAAIAEKTQTSGYFNAFLDKDGTIRRSNLVVRHGDQYLSSLALKSVLKATNQGLLVKIDRSIKDPSLKSITQMSFTNNETGEIITDIPVDESGRIAINFAGKQKMFPHVSVYELFNNKPTVKVEVQESETKSIKEDIEGIFAELYRKAVALITGKNNSNSHGDGKIVIKEVPKDEFFKDKILIMGATATGIYDLRVTPFEENYPGVETHANIVDNLLRGDYLRNHPDEQIYMSIFLLLIGIIFSFALSKMGAVPGLLVTVALYLSIYYVDKIYFFSSGIVIAITLPFLLMALLYVSLTFFKYFTEEKKKKELKGTFQKYVSPAIVDEVLADAKNIELGGKKVRMTVLFSDVRGFTTISEKLDPKALGDFLNSYLTPMTELVFSNKGTLDKYMGDAVMAFFGAPIHFENHAEMACHCCLQMMEKLAELQGGYKEQGLPPIDIGIGLNTGEMSVGNMGSETVRSYTVMGDAVNLGSRLEGINKQYGTHIIISEFTYADVKDKFVCREIDRVRVKGKLEPVRIYELVGDTKKFQDEDKLKVVELFSKGFEQYIAKDFSGANKTFNEALQIDAEDGPSLLFLQRSQDYIDNPPPEDWDGVFTMTTK